MPAVERQFLRAVDMSHKISVKALGESKYQVTVQEGGSQTVHEVIASASDVERYGRGATPERLLEASFEFLLKREPKESILRRFNLPEIEQYFPDYPQKIGT
jgi:hypothetical protein